MFTWSLTYEKAYLCNITVKKISQRFTHEMAAKTAGADMKQNYVSEHCVLRIADHSLPANEISPAARYTVRPATFTQLIDMVSATLASRKCFV